MEAHNGLSARIVEEAGFEGIWASGLTMSASFGLRDNNELSWSQVVDHVAFMVEATSIPILLDGDTGYGNFNSMRRLVRKLEQVGVAGVTIEDKLFPKTNSFLRGETPGPGRRRRVLRQDQGRQGQPGRFRFRAGGAGGGTHRRLGAGRGAPAGRGLSPGRRRRDPDPLAGSRARPRSLPSLPSGELDVRSCWCRPSTGARPRRISGRAG